MLGGASSQEGNGGGGGSAGEGASGSAGRGADSSAGRGAGRGSCTDGSGKGEGPSGSGEGSGGSAARVPAQLPVGGMLSGGVDNGGDNTGPEPAVPDTYEPVQGKVTAEAAQLLSELEPVWQHVREVLHSDMEEEGGVDSESEGASLGEILQLSDTEQEEFNSPGSSPADSSDSEDEVLISRAKRQQAPSR